MLTFGSSLPLVLSQPDLDRMVLQTLSGLTEHAGDGQTVARVLTQLSLDQNPFLLLGLPGKNYIVSRLQLTLEHKVKDIIRIAAT